MTYFLAKQLNRSTLDSHKMFRMISINGILAVNSTKLCMGIFDRPKWTKACSISPKTSSSPSEISH